MKKSLAKILALVLCAAMVIGAAAGCTPKEPTPPTTSTPPASNAPVDTPKEILPDVPADRYDATKTPRTGANASSPLVLSVSTLDGKFSPFFATSAYDVDVSGMTELPLITVDKFGAPQAGIEWPCYAYSYSQEVSADKSASTYKFILKNGITFSDGQPVTAKDLLFSIYVYADPLYDGSSTFYTMKIQGMSEYRLQTSAENLAVAEAILAAGITDDNGTMKINPANGATAEQQTAFWSYLDQAGAMFAQDIVDYVKGKYLSDDYVHKYFSEELTADEVAASPELLVAFGMAMWGYSGDPAYDKATNTFTDTHGNAYVIGTDALTSAEYWKAILANYGYDLSDNGVNAEIAGSVNVEQYCSDLYIANEGGIAGGVSSISGITTGVETGADGVDREYLQIVMDGVDPTAIFKLTLSVSPSHYYTQGYTGQLNEFGVALKDPAFIQTLKDKNNAPMGAGPYMFDEYKDNVVYYTANDGYLMGSPKVKTLRYQEITLGAELDAVLTGTVHFTDPSAKTQIINDITAAQGDYANLAYTLVDNDGYGYIGINGRFFPEWQVRKALAHAMNTALTLDYYGELATINYRTMTKIQWAYPENPQNLFPYDATGETSKALFLEAGYIYDAAANIMYYPEGHEKAGQQFTVKATLPSAAADHPAGSVLLDLQEVLAKIGVKLDIESDTALLNKLSTAYESGIQMWTAAWGSGGTDPDMFQIWCSDPSRNQSTSPTAKGLYWLYDNGSDDQKAALRQLNDLIDAGRSTLDVEERKVIYGQALEISTGTATEIPTYQRKNMFIYDKTVVNGESLFSGEDVTPFQSPIRYIWNVELVG